MRIVLDTNVIISALLFDGNPEKLLLAALAGPDQLVLSSYIVTETIRILEAKFAVQPNNIELLQQLLNEADMVYFEPFLNILTDEPDNRILETAVKGAAQYLITGDRLLLELSKYENVHIVSVTNYLKISGDKQKRR
jgi:putative PIN family toxin of toxin-antitoxin system